MLRFELSSIILQKKRHLEKNLLTLIIMEREKQIAKLLIISKNEDLRNRVKSAITTLNLSLEQADGHDGLSGIPKNLPFDIVVIDLEKYLDKVEIIKLLEDKKKEIEEVQSEVQNQLKSLKHYEGLFVCALDGMVVLTKSGEIVFANRSASKMLGKEPLKLKYVFFSDVLIQKERTMFEELLYGFTKGETERTMDFTFKTKDLEQGVMAISAGSRFDEEGMMLLTLRDVTAERATEQNLKEARRKLLESEKIVAMAELAGAAAHELNQPLTSILTSLAMLRRVDKDDPRQNRLIDTIERESERMAEIIRRMSRLTIYTTKSYVGKAKIIDLAQSSETDKDV